MSFSLPTVKLRVRDYECDLQGVLNNAVYLNYYEHARSQVFSHIGSSLAKEAARGYLFSVAELSIRYLAPLYPGDDIAVASVMHTKGVMRLIFEQQINHQDRLCNQAKVTVVATKNGVPQPVDWLLEKLNAEEKG